jgi:hypothetical protein
MAKIGEEHLRAMARLGLRELRAAAYPNSNIAQSPEYGLYGTKTPGEVAEDRRDDGLSLEDEGPKQRESTLKDRLKEVASRGHGRDAAELTMPYGNDPPMQLDLER